MPYCKLKEKNVNLVKESSSEIGGDRPMSLRLKCSAKDRSCEEAGCRYAPRGIGDVGNIDPFA